MEFDYLKVRNYEETKIDVSEVGDFYILSFSNKEHIKVSEIAKKIIEKFDGTKTIDEIIFELKQECIPLNHKDLVEFIKKYLINNFLLENSVESKSESKLWFHFPLFKGNKLANVLLPLNFLYNDFVILLVIVSTLSIQLYFIKLGYYSTNETIDIYNLNSISIFTIVFASFFIHELGHVVAALKYKVSVGDMGIGLYLFRPVFYTDLSDAWKLDRKKRIVTDLGGIYFQLISILILSLCLIFYNTDTLKISILLIMISIIGNINPILRFDGYWVITDFLGIVNVDKRAIEFIKSLISNLFKNKNFKATIGINFKKGIKKIFYIYVFLYIIFTCGSLILGFYLVINLIVNPKIITTCFELLYLSIKARNIVMFISKLNNSLIIILPLLYVILLLGNIIKGLFKIKIVNLKKVN